MFLLLYLAITLVSIILLWRIVSKVEGRLEETILEIEALKRELATFRSQNEIAH
jgi:hypothetical protein